MKSETLLSRIYGDFPSEALSLHQAQVDQLVEGFVSHATDWRSLGALAVGGMVYRLGRIGAMTVGMERFASTGLGLVSEVTAFEMTNRSLSSLTGEGRSHPNLWRWEGQGGIRQGLLSSLVTFGTLKGAGRLAQGENVVVQHLLQDTGMVLGHQVSGAFEITPRPTGSLAEQFLHAEVTNLQLSAGMALAHSVAPGIQGIERGLDLSLRSEGSHRQGLASPGLQPTFATAEGPPVFSSFEKKFDTTLSLMASDRPEGGSVESERRGSSQPPLEGGVIETDALAWAVREKRPQEDAVLVAKLAQAIRSEIWQTLNLRIDSPEAQILASGQKIWVQLHSLDGTLENYRVVLAPLRQAPSGQEDFVQWVLHPKNGTLTPIIQGHHGRYLPRPGSESWSTHHPGFLPFYYGIRFESEGLKSGPLFEELNPQLRDFLRHDRTLMLKTRPALSSSQKGTGPTLLVLYFSEISEGIRKHIDALCDAAQIHDKGRAKLQRLIHHILVVIYETEARDPKYGLYPSFHIWVTPNPEAPGKMKVHVSEAGEAWKWHQKERGGQIGPEDILLVLNRSTPGSESNWASLSHQYTHTDRQRNPIGADLRFQEGLGFGSHPVSLNLPDFVPTREKRAEWDAKLEEDSKG